MATNFAFFFGTAGGDSCSEDVEGSLSRSFERFLKTLVLDGEETFFGKKIRDEKKDDRKNKDIKFCFMTEGGSEGKKRR